jgi:hypothetical protein
MRTLRTALFAAALLALASGCGLSNQFYAELEEPGICRTFQGVVMDPTAPGAELVLVLPIPVTQDVPLFDTAGGGVVFKLLSVTFDSTNGTGIQDFNSVDSAWVTALPDQTNPNGQVATEVIRYDKAPNVLPGKKLTIGGNSDVDLVPFLSSSGGVTVEARMTGGLPNNNWTSDITGCLYAKARLNYLDAYGIHF